MEDTKSIWYFIVNPHAGSGKTMCEWIPAEKKMHTLGIKYRTAYTDYKRHATELAKIAARKGYRRICAVGGDGSVHEAFNGICEWCEETGTDPMEFTIAVMPIGSGNDWIKSTAVPNDPIKVVDLINASSFSTMDIIKLESAGGKVSYMANIGGVGFDSHVCERVNKQKEQGHRNKLIYLNGLLNTIFHIGSINVTILADGRNVFSGPCYSIALGNGCWSGGGMRQVPNARMDDGILDSMVVPKVKLIKLLKEAPKLFSGTIDKSENVLSFRCRELRIMPEDAASADIIELDGEIEGTLPARISVTGKHIRILSGESGNTEA